MTQYVVLTNIEPQPPIIETPVMTAVGPFNSEAEAIAYQKKHGGWRVVPLMAGQS